MTPEERAEAFHAEHVRFDGVSWFFNITVGEIASLIRKAENDAFDKAADEVGWVQGNTEVECQIEAIRDDILDLKHKEPSDG